MSLISVIHILVVPIFKKRVAAIKYILAGISQKSNGESILNLYFKFIKTYFIINTLTSLSIQSYGTSGGGTEQPDVTHTYTPVGQESKK